MPEPKPQLAAAFLCEKVLQEKDGVMSAIRIVDTFWIQKPPGPQPPQAIPVVAVTLFLAFKAAGAKGAFQLKVRLVGLPNDLTPTIAPEPTVPMNFSGEQEEQGANFVMNFAVPVREFRLYYFEVLVNDELVTKVPFKLREADSTVVRPHQ